MSSKLILESAGVTVIATVLPFEERDHLEEAGIIVQKLDVTSEDQVTAFTATIEKLTSGKLDFLFNNA